MGKTMTPVDVWSANQIDAAINLVDGASALLAGVVESAPFQKCRKAPSASASLPPSNTVAVNSLTP